MGDLDQAVRTPQISDFSPGAINRSVLTTTLQHPLSLYPVVIGILGLAVFLLLSPAMLALGIAAGGLSLGVGSWMVNYFLRHDQFARRYVDTLHAALAEERQVVLQRLQQELAVCQTITGTADFAAQGAEQFQRIQEKFDNLQDMLADKLHQGELTYSRYFGTAEQVYLSVLDNLEAIVTGLKSTSAIDETYIRRRISALRQRPALSDSDQQEIETLRTRYQLRKDQLEHVNGLLTRNEEAMTAIDQTVTALAGMQTGRTRATVDMETARNALEDLAKRAPVKIKMEV